MQRIEMKRLEMTKIEMVRLLMDPVSIELGPQALTNPSFEDMQLGSEQILDGDFSSAVNWNLGPGWSIDTVLGTLTHDGTAKSNTTQLGFTAYQAIKTEIVTDSNAQTPNKALVRETFLQNKWNLSNTAPAIDVNWECNAGTAPTIFSIRDTEENLSSRVFSSISVKPVTLTGWTELGTRTAAEHMCFNHETEQIQIVSGGLEMGITQDISDGDTYGSELQPNSDLSGTGGGFDGTGSGSGDVADDYTVFLGSGDIAACSKDGDDYQVISVTQGADAILRATANKPTLSNGTFYKASITLASITGSIDWMVAGSSISNNVQFQSTISASGVYSVYFYSDADFDASVYLRFIDNGESCTISEASIKEVTTAVPVFTPGEHYYNVELTGVDSGSVKLATPSDGTLATFNAVGSRAGVVDITDPNIRFEANGACNIDVGAVTLYPVIGGVE